MPLVITAPVDLWRLASEHEQALSIARREDTKMKLDTGLFAPNLNDAGEMLLVRQERRAVGAFTVEVPAGLIDAGEQSEAAARREMQEEAGLSAEKPAS